MQDERIRHGHIDGTAIFQDYRPLLFAIAYRMTGSGMEADDLLQETYLRWQQVDWQAVESPKSMLTTILTRLAIDHMRSARVRRETYTGNWLPEPLAGSAWDTFSAAAPDAAHTLLMEESLSTAFLLLLERLNPIERAAFLLHDVFDYDYAEVADIVEKSPANCRQIVHRARTHLQNRPRFTPDEATQSQLLGHFLDAVQHGDMAPLLARLTEDVTLWSDGGGKTPTALRPVHGGERILHMLGNLYRRTPGAALQIAQVGGQAGCLVLIHGALQGVVTFRFAPDIDDEPDADGRSDVHKPQVDEIYAVMNPDKLARYAEELGLALVHDARQ